jgi:hypothetical protein
MKFSVLKISVAALAISSVMVSCTGGGNDNEMTAADSAALKASKAKAQKVFIAIPSPLEMANMIKSTGATFNKSILNPVSSVAKYTSSLSQALNLGIYSTDLSYCSNFDQNQDAMQYMATSKKLADALGVTGALSESLIERLEKNVNNKDSLMDLISESYETTDSYLKENDRASTASIIVTGAWVEGLYISCMIAKQSPKNTEIIARIADQKMILADLISLLESYPADASLNQVTSDMKNLKTLFDNISVSTTAGEIKTDEAKGVTEIGDKSEANVSADAIAAITQKIIDLRNSYVK